MQKILSAFEINNLDQIHLKRKGFSNHAFMELVAQRFVDWFQSQGYSSAERILVCAGAGNNGGDGLAIARILFSLGYTVEVAVCFSVEAKLSPDCTKTFPFSLPKLSATHLVLPPCQKMAFSLMRIWVWAVLDHSEEKRSSVSKL